MAERKNRIIEEAAKEMLENKTIPKFFLAEGQQSTFKIRHL